MVRYLRGKKCGIRYYSADKEHASPQPVDLRPYLTEFQVMRFGRDPLMIQQLAEFIANDLRTQGRSDVRIHVLALVSLNGRKPQPMIDPTVDLAAVDAGWHWGPPSWVVPLSEPRRCKGWNVPLDEWGRHIKLPANLRSATR